ncbi:MAG: ribonuclease HI family protein [Sedimentisphaerales bacterium]|nr:ribonuclease HI family protein [Sedimentisphaerales bacterium]
MKLQIHTDGGARGNPGPAGAGVVICDEKGRELFTGGFYLGETTNNAAEYQGLIRGLEQAATLNGDELDIAMDSELIVRQINGQYRVKNAQLKPLYERARELMDSFKAVAVRHVYREQNARADMLVNQAIDTRADVSGAAHDSSSVKETALCTIIHQTDLREKAAALAGAVHLGTHHGLVSELVHLQSHSTQILTGPWQQATLVVLRGEGVCRLGERQISLSLGHWLHLGFGDKLELATEDGHSMVALFTRLND